MNPMSNYPARPDVTQEMRLAAATVIASLLDSDYGDIAEDLATIDGEHMDGYELCKELEDRFYYTGSMRLCEELDGYSTEIRRLREAAEKEWAIKHNVQPPYPVGTKIKTGVIVGVYEHGAAQYLVDYGHADRKRIIRFEDAHPVA